MHRSEKSKYTKAKLAPKVKVTYSKAVDPNVTAYAVSALNWLRQAAFLMSAPKLALCVDDIGFEIAFAGRSNAGKSSAINALTNQRQLARASKRPGRTQMINFFSLGNPEQRLVDLPGYGYAAVPEEMKRVWQKELENYLIQRQSLQGLVLLMDIRHPLQNFDLMMLQWAHSRQLFVHILLTKSDKLNRGPAHKVLHEVKSQLQKLSLNFSIQLFSSMDKQGLEELAAVMGGRLHYTLDQDGRSIPHVPLATAADFLDEADFIDDADKITKDDFASDNITVAADDMTNPSHSNNLDVNDDDSKPNNQ